MPATEPHHELVNRLVPLLLEGDDPCLEGLRRQWEASTVTITCETNWGFYPDFGVPEGIEKVLPPNFAGGNAIIKIDGVKNDGGCILYVKNGELNFLEVYTYDEPWESPPHFGAVTQCTPIVPGEDASGKVYAHKPQ